MVARSDRKRLLRCVEEGLGAMDLQRRENRLSDFLLKGVGDGLIVS